MDQMSSGDSSSDSQSSSSSSSDDSSSSSDSEDETRPSSGRSHAVPVSTHSMPILTSQERSDEGSGHLMNTLSEYSSLFIYTVLPTVCALFLYHIPAAFPLITAYFYLVFAFGSVTVAVLNSFLLRGEDFHSDQSCQKLIKTSPKLKDKLCYS